jgi:UDPglucose 6-dehydrogenase
VGRLASTNSVVVLKSTVPPGSAALVKEALERPEILVATNPEFLREGTALDDFLNPDRIIVGAEDEATSYRVLKLFSGLESRGIQMTLAAAELSKYASNAILAMRLSFVNDLASFCERLGVSFGQLSAGLASDSRIGPSYLEPGPGWGGSCFPKDTLALLMAASENGLCLPIVEATL